MACAATFDCAETCALTRLLHAKLFRIALATSIFSRSRLHTAQVNWMDWSAAFDCAESIPIPTGHNSCLTVLCSHTYDLRGLSTRHRRASLMLGLLPIPRDCCYMVSCDDFFRALSDASNCFATVEDSCQQVCRLSHGKLTHSCFDSRSA